MNELQLHTTTLMKLIRFVIFVSKSQKTINKGKKIINTKLRMVVLFGGWEEHSGRCSLLQMVQSPNHMVMYFKKNIWKSI